MWSGVLRYRGENVSSCRIEQERKQISQGGMSPLVLMRVIIALATCMHTTSTEQDAAMVGDPDSWHSVAVNMRASGDSLASLRAATTCTRLRSHDNKPILAKCHTLAGTLLALDFGRDIQALVHFQRAANLQEGLETCSNVGLAFSRLYLNDLAVKCLARYVKYLTIYVK